MGHPKVVYEPVSGAWGVLRGEYQVLRGQGAGHRGKINKSPSASLRTVTLVWSVVVWAGTQTNLPGSSAMSLLF